MTLSELKSQPGTSLIVYYSQTCGPCRLMKPMIRSIMEESGVAGALHEVDIAIDMDAVKSLGIRAVPALVRVQDGDAFVLHVGAMTEPQTRSVLTTGGVIDPTQE